jgi:hypothetical protein
MHSLLNVPPDRTAEALDGHVFGGRQPEPRATANATATRSATTHMPMSGDG